MHKNKKYGSIVISNGSAVTSWKTYVIEDPNIIKNVRIKDVGKKYKDEEGGNSDKEYKFKALKEGKTKIYIQYQLCITFRHIHNYSDSIIGSRMVLLPWYIENT